MKKISYFVTWTAAVFGVSVFNYFAVVPVLSWYSGENLPPLTPHIMLLIWIGGMALHCVALALLISGVSQKQNIGGVLFPLPAVIINQAAASAVCLAVGIASKFNSMLFFSAHFMTAVINKYAPGTVHSQNQSIWIFVLSFVIIAIFTAVSTVFYFIERKRQNEMLKRAVSSDD